MCQQRRILIDGSSAIEMLLLCKPYELHVMHYCLSLQGFPFLIFISVQGCVSQKHSKPKLIVESISGNCSTINLGL